jgi:hypothetical protein
VQGKRGGRDGGTQEKGREKRRDGKLKVSEERT